ncbi:hypothetical protein FGG65_gp31 [Corynebacterium phage phi673]|uniref:Uncharacterized protein n=1 Tax=Corynebacterium phage phi673 TaxID=2052821 RepID=A0A2H4PIY6_9CAUD|nr:hypothetical protein FGG65_gp31 [Corynebacterium phage phi673]ATW62893.1 hypothetical protein phi673_gp31 [Corynebacterium phage phi673]
MSYTYEDLLKAAHSLQINGDFVTVTYPFSNTQLLQVVTSQGLEIYLCLEHDWVDGITTVLWTCADSRSDGVIVESPHQVIADLAAQIHQLHKATS